MNTNIQADAGFAIKHYKNHTIGEGADAKVEPRPDPYYSVIGKDEAGNVVAIRVEQALGDAALDALVAQRMATIGEEVPGFKDLAKALVDGVESISKAVSAFGKGAAKVYAQKAAKAPVVEEPTAA